MIKKFNPNLYRIALYKNYFDLGFGITNYFKYIIAFIGLSSLNVKLTLIIAVIYGIFCFFLGYIAFVYGFVDYLNEVGNRFNPFVREMRKHIKKKKFK